jgi:hypothetical protein
MNLLGASTVAIAHLGFSVNCNDNLIIILPELWQGRSQGLLVNRAHKCLSVVSSTIDFGLRSSAPRRNLTCSNGKLDLGILKICERSELDKMGAVIHSL